MTGHRGWDGEPRVVAAPAASAAAGVALALPGVVTFAVVSFAFKLHTAAGGGARQVVAKLVDATGAVLFAEAAPATQAGGLDVVYSFAPDTAAFGSSALGFMGGNFPGRRLPQNLTVEASVAGNAAGDLLEQVRLLVHQWPTRDEG